MANKGTEAVPSEQQKTFSWKFMKLVIPQKFEDIWVLSDLAGLSAATATKTPQQLITHRIMCRGNKHGQSRFAISHDHQAGIKSEMLFSICHLNKPCRYFL